MSSAHLRRQVQERRQAGRIWGAIAEAPGVGRRSVISWATRFGVDGKSEFQNMVSGRRGRIFGENRALTLARETLLRDRILEGSPSQLEIPGAMFCDCCNKEIKLFYLPAYSPKPDPEELINRYLKTELRARPASSSRGTLPSLENNFMQRLQDMPQRIANHSSGSHPGYAGVPNGACTA